MRNELSRRPDDSDGRLSQPPPQGRLRARAQAPTPRSVAATVAFEVTLRPGSEEPVDGTSDGRDDRHPRRCVPGVVGAPGAAAVGTRAGEDPDRYRRGSGGMAGPTVVRALALQNEAEPRLMADIEAQGAPNAPVVLPTGGRTGQAVGRPSGPAADRGDVDDLPLDQLDAVLRPTGCRPRPSGSSRPRRTGAATPARGIRGWSARAGRFLPTGAA